MFGEDGIPIGRPAREEHLNWCKQRAKDYLKQGDIENALASMFSDLGKHPDTRNHPAIMVGGMLRATGNLSTIGEVENFIDGFN
jgi:hypothetical protein